MTKTMKKIRNIVDVYGWSQREFAEKVGTTEVSMSRWLNGKRSPSIENVEKMVTALGMEMQIHKI